MAKIVSKAFVVTLSKLARDDEAADLMNDTALADFEHQLNALVDELTGKSFVVETTTV